MTTLNMKSDNFSRLNKLIYNAKNMNKFLFKRNRDCIFYPYRSYNNDILKFDIEKLKIKDSIIFGNLPYNISSQTKKILIIK